MLSAMVPGAREMRFPAIDIRLQPPRTFNPKPDSRYFSIPGSTSADSGSGGLAQQSPITNGISLSTGNQESATNNLTHSGSLSDGRPAGSSGPRSGTRKRRQHKCSICGQCFARAEHLIRHERSHRKERPFACDQCNTTFTRKDLLKRHVSRYHPELTPATRTNEAMPQGHDNADIEEVLRVDPGSAGENILQPDHDNAAPGQTNVGAIQSNDSLDDTMPLSADPHPPQVAFSRVFLDEPRQAGDLPEVIVEPALEGANGMNHSDHFDFEQSLGELSVSPLMLQSPSSLLRGYGDEAHSFHSIIGTPSINHFSQLFSNLPDDPSASTISFAAPTRPKPYDVDPAYCTSALRLKCLTGPYFISEERRNIISEDTQAVFTLARVPDEFSLPSCMALERYITMFVDCFLLHTPCIHLPTFIAETAHPSLVLAMAALGANYHEDRDIAVHLHRAARLSILNQMERTSWTSKGRPTWVLQSLFLVMVFGVWRNDFDAVQESLAIQSNLSHIVRYVNHPGACWFGDTQNLSLSWEEWAELEAMKRTKYAIYKFFNQLTVTYNVPPVLANSEINMDLPWEESFWLADNAGSWRSSEKLSPPTFQDALRDILSGAEPSARPCSEFGLSVILSALLQRIWQSRQADSPSEALADAPKIEAALQKWQIMATTVSVFPPSIFRRENALFHDSVASLRLAYVMLCLDMSRLKAVNCHQDAQDIAQAMRNCCSEVQRSKLATKAALFACHAFRRLVKSGLNMVTRTGSLEISPQCHTSWFDISLYLSKWLQTVSASGGSDTLTQDEQDVQSLLQETLYEADPSLLQSHRPLAVQLMETWATALTRHEIWGHVSTLGSAMLEYAAAD